MKNRLHTNLLSWRKSVGNEQLRMLAIAAVALIGLCLAGLGLYHRLNSGMPVWGKLELLATISGIAVLLGSLLASRFPETIYETSRLAATTLRSVLIAVPLLIGITLRLVEVTKDHLDLDEYYFMRGVEGSFATYINLYRGPADLPQLAHYWLSYRLIGDSLAAYRSLSLAVSILGLIATFLFLRALWPTRPRAVFFAMLVFAFNANALYLSSYAMFLHGNTLFVSILLIFLLMRWAKGTLHGGRWWLALLVLILFAFFTRIYLIVPLVIGVACALLFRLLGTPRDARNLRAIAPAILRVLPLAIIPLAYALLLVVYPFTNVGPDKRPDMVGFFYSTSEYAGMTLGPIQFIMDRTSRLLAATLKPVGPGALTILPALVAMASLTVVGVWQAFKSQHAPGVRFATVLLAGTLFVMAFSSLLDVFPYGSVRYAPFLLPILLVLVGYGADVIWEAVFRRLKTENLSAFVLLQAVVLATIFGSVVSYWRYEEHTSQKQANNVVIDYVRRQRSDAVLADSYQSAILSVRAPALMSRLHTMGWGSYWSRNNVVSEQVRAVLEDAVTQGDVQDLLVVLTYRPLGQFFPLEAVLVSNNFDLVDQMDGPDISAYRYNRKGEPSTGSH